MDTQDVVKELLDERIRFLEANGYVEVVRNEAGGIEGLTITERGRAYLDMLKTIPDLLRGGYVTHESRAAYFEMTGEELPESIKTMPTKQAESFDQSRLICARNSADYDDLPGRILGSCVACTSEIVYHASSPKTKERICLECYTKTKFAH